MKNSLLIVTLSLISLLVTETSLAKCSELDPPEYQDCGAPLEVEPAKLKVLNCFTFDNNQHFATVYENHPSPGLVSAQFAQGGKQTYELRETVKEIITRIYDTQVKKVYFGYYTEFSLTGTYASYAGEKEPAVYDGAFIAEMQEPKAIYCKPVSDFHSYIGPENQ